jgi:hypothetical protein
MIRLSFFPASSRSMKLVHVSMIDRLTGGR